MELKEVGFETHAWAHFLGGKVRKLTLPQLQPPVGPDGPAMKRLMLAQGELSQFYDGEEGMRYLAAIEFVPGVTRGNHYHLTKEEWVYVLEGELDIWVLDRDSGRREVVPACAGDLVLLPTGIGHALQARTAAWAIEYSSARFDPRDSFRCEAKG